MSLLDSFGSIGSLLGGTIGLAIGGPGGAVAGSAIGGGIGGVVQMGRGGASTRRSDYQTLGQSFYDFQQRLGQVNVTSQAAAAVRRAGIGFDDNAFGSSAAMRGAGRNAFGKLRQEGLEEGAMQRGQAILDYREQLAARKQELQARLLQMEQRANEFAVTGVQAARTQSQQRRDDMYNQLMSGTMGMAGMMLGNKMMGGGDPGAATTQATATAGMTAGPNQPFRMTPRPLDAQGHTPWPFPGQARPLGWGIKNSRPWVAGGYQYQSSIGGGLDINPPTMGRGYSPVGSINMRPGGN